MCAHGALRQHEKEKEKWAKKQKAGGLTEGQLREMGYTAQHVANIMKNCEREWDDEIEEAFVVSARCSQSGGVVRPNSCVAFVKQS